MSRQIFSCYVPSRRHFLRSFPALAIVPAMSPVAPPSTVRLLQRESGANQRLRITGMETIAVRATARTTWLFVRLATNQGLMGLGEASLGGRTELVELESFFELVRDESPFQIEHSAPTIQQHKMLCLLLFRLKYHQFVFPVHHLQN